MDKTKERAFVETARKLYPWFPPGDIVEHEAPDFLLLDGTDRIGIEVTQLFQRPKHGARHPPHEVARFHQRVMEMAEQRATLLRPLDVLVYFSYRHHMSDAAASAQALIDFVQAHPCGTYEMLDGIPHGFSVVRIAEPLANQIPRWRCQDSGETLGVTQEMLSTIIREKNRRVAAYRANVDRVWLLIASSFWQFASSFYVPREIDDWRFDFDFDKVLVMSQENGVFNLQRSEQRPSPESAPWSGRGRSITSSNPLPEGSIDRSQPGDRRGGAE
jgi:hypothetical protein